MPLRATSNFIIGIALLLTVPSVAQDLLSDPEVVHPNIRISVQNLSSVSAPAESNGEIAKAAVATVLSASNVQCDPASQLNTILEANGGAPLRELAAKLKDTSCMTNGRIVHLNASFTSNESIHADDILAPLVHGKPLLTRWNGELYVLYGAIYDQHLHNSGKRENVIRQLLLISPRHSDERRFISFDRQKDNFAQVEGIAEIQFKVP